MFLKVSLRFRSSPFSSRHPSVSSTPASTPTLRHTRAPRLFLARIELKKDLKPGPLTITLEPRYQTCSGTSCIPPRTRDVSATLNIDPSAPVASIAIPAGYVEGKPSAPAPVTSAALAPAAESGLAPFLALAFGFGLAAIFTPCVFPMIPITMSYFVGQQGGLFVRPSLSALASSSCSAVSVSS